MSTAIRVDSPGESFAPTDTAVRAPAPAYFDARIPATIVDDTRRQARARTYPNSETEAATVRAVDDALFERVRASERYQISQADRFLDSNAGRVATALEYVDKLEDLRRRLEAGEDTTNLATEYRRIEREVRGRELRVLDSLAGNAEKLDANLDDPVGHFQRILSLQPLHNWQPIQLDS